MASDYSPPRLVKPTPGGNPGDGSMDGALTFLQGKTFPGTAPANKTGILYADSIYGECWLSTPSWLHLQDGPGTGRIKLGSVGIYLGTFTLGMGIVPIYGLGQRVTVAATTSPGTTIATFTPGATGSLKVNVTIKNKDTTSVTANVLVSYTDPDVGAQTVLIINGVSIGASGIASAHFVLDSTATAITVSAYGSVADELVCTADIEQFN